MSEPPHLSGPAERGRLAASLREIDVARGRLRAGRQVGARSTDVQRLRSELLSALEGYAAQITRLGAPIPPRLRSEIELYRRLRNRG